MVAAGRHLWTGVAALIVGWLPVLPGPSLAACEICDGGAVHSDRGVPWLSEVMGR